MKKSKNFLISYIRGEISLVKSYWLIATLGGIIVSSPLIYAEANEFKVSLELINFLIYYIYLTLAYAVVAYVGVWNSATKYIIQKKKTKKSAFWGYAAKVLVVLGFLRGILDFIGIE